jgi:hypothetical protein
LIFISDFSGTDLAGYCPTVYQAGYNIMNNSDLDLDLSEMKVTEHKLQSLVDISGKGELAQCLRLLSIYIALYKKSYGELPPSSFDKIMTSELIDTETARIFENGMLEAISILKMVLRSKTELSSTKGITIN